MRAVNKKIYVIITVSALTAAVIVGLCMAGGRKELTQLIRPEYGELYKDYELDVVYEGSEEKISVTVNEKRLTFEEAEELFAKAYDELRLAMQEQNGNLNRISGNLKLPESVLDGRLEITWYSSDTEYVENNGELTDKAYKGLPEEEFIVTMYAKVSAQEYSASFEVPVCLSSSVIAASRSAEAIITDMLMDTEQAQAKSSVITLPSQIDGNEVKYYEKQKSQWWKYPLLVIIVVFMYLFMKKHKAETIKKNRQRQLELSYAPVVTKLMLLTGAGSSIRGAWERLAKDYKGAGDADAAYEELVKVNNEMKNGMSEQQAYSVFGKRCGLSMYVRLGNLLEQNLRKGTRGLSEHLEEEVREAFENRKALAIKLGEEAGTKLLIPMLLLLVIIIVICVVPAFLCM